MLNALKELLSQKKGIMALAGSIAALLAYVGLNVPADVIAIILTPLVTYIIGQGIADSGKSAAVINASKPPDRIQQTVNVDAKPDSEPRQP